MRYHRSLISQPPKGLVSHWRFDGNVLDSVGNNDGTINGDPQFVQGVSGQALSFDGVDDYVGVSDSNNLDAGTGGLTVACWFKVDLNASESYPRIMTKAPGGRYGDTKGYQLALVNDYLIPEIGDGTANEASRPAQPAINSNQWYHLAMTWDGQAHVVYLDGTNIGQGAFT